MGGLVALQFAHPAGVVLAASTGVVVRLSGDALRRFWDERSQTVLAPSVKEWGDDGLAELLVASPQASALALRALQVGGVIPIEEHVQVLGQVLHDGLTETLDPLDAVSLVEILGRLTPESVAVLDGLTGDSGLDPPTPTHLDRRLASALQMPMGTLRAALSILETNGAASRTRGGSNGEDGYEIQPLGLQLLEYLRVQEQPPEN